MKLVILLIVSLLIILFILQNNYEHYDGYEWEDRFPTMVNARYSYDDHEKNKNMAFYDYAILDQLPTQLKNVYHAVLPSNCTQSYPSVVKKVKIDTSFKGFDYDHMRTFGINAGDGTPDEYNDLDKINHQKN